MLRTLEVAELSSSAVLRERAMDTMLEHAEQVVFSPEYEGFAVRNAGLCVEITRALLAKMSTTTTSRQLNRIPITHRELLLLLFFSDTCTCIVSLKL